MNISPSHQVADSRISDVADCRREQGRLDTNRILASASEGSCSLEISSMYCSV